jgi:hypothetical protein
MLGVNAWKNTKTGEVRFTLDRWFRPFGQPPPGEAWVRLGYVEMPIAPEAPGESRRPGASVMEESVEEA